MVVKKRKKGVRFRGYTTYGKGSMKKGRGTGNRGGKGNAGSGKRADSKKPMFWGEKFGHKQRFKGKCMADICINIMDIEMHASKWTNHEVDLVALGITKLLGKGTPTKPWKVKVAKASAKAKEKLEKAGGVIVNVECDNKQSS